MSWYVVEHHRGVIYFLRLRKQHRRCSWYSYDPTEAWVFKSRKVAERWCFRWKTATRPFFGPSHPVKVVETEKYADKAMRQLLRLGL